VVVFDHQDPWTSHESRSGLNDVRNGFLCGRSGGQGKIEPASLPNQAFKTQVAAMEFHQAVGDGQTQAGALGFFAGLAKTVENFEDTLLLIRWNTRPIVPDFDENAVTVQTCAEFDSAAVLSELDGVSQKVHEDLLEPSGIATHGQASRCVFGQHLHLLASQRLHHA
jgi:hypothetical protein